MAAIRPITGMPAAHPLVNGQVDCPGYTFTEGQAIPVTGHWERKARCDRFAANAVSGAEMFYAYGRPDGSSANTGRCTAAAIPVPPTFSLTMLVPIFFIYGND